jgi:hypothetical protein
VFKCASDTIFLDDFKSVLDDIVGRSLGNSGGRVNTRRKNTDPNFPEFIECGPMTTSIATPSTPVRSRSINSFSSRDQRMSRPKLYVQQETSVTVSNPAIHNRSLDSFDSYRGILSPPTTTKAPERKDHIHSVAWPRSHAGSTSRGLSPH